jgi:hypothetical protein
MDLGNTCLHMDLGSTCLHMDLRSTCLHMDLGSTCLHTISVGKPEADSTGKQGGDGRLKLTRA